MTELRLASDSLSQEALQALTRDVERAVNAETDVEARYPEAEPLDGEKGAGIEAGTLLLMFLSSGTAVALIELIRAFFDRDKSIEIEFERSDSKFVLRASNVSQDRIDETIESFKKFLDG